MNEEVSPIERRLRVTEGTVDQHEQRIGRQERASEVQHDEIIRAKTAFAKLSEVVQAVIEAKEEAEPPVPPFSWLTASDPLEAEVKLLALEEWTGRVLIHFPDGRLADCWRRHPNTVEELLVLQDGHDSAWAPRGAVSGRFDWLNRWLPETLKRVKEEMKGCSLDKHADPDAHVPAIQSRLDQIDVEHWTTNHGRRPEVPPSPEALAEAQARKIDSMRGRTRTR